MLLHKSAFKGIPSYFLQKNGKCPERYLEGVTCFIVDSTICLQ